MAGISISSVSPTENRIGVPSTYVVVWEWENRPNRWRPYSPEVTQLLERAHQKKINKIYLKDADPLLCDYYINMITFEQYCEPTGAKYPVRREFYPHTSPAGKGAKWEWCGDTKNEWYVYDMDVQLVIEESWTKGEQTNDISKHFPGFPYIMNFCNLTQVRTNTGVVRPIRRLPQAAYPMVKLTQAEIASMIHRKEERMKVMFAEVERRQNLKKKEKKGKMAVKQLMSQIFHKDKQRHENENLKLDSKRHLQHFRSQSLPFHQQQPQQQFNGISRRAIGHPSSMSEINYPSVLGPGPRRFRIPSNVHHQRPAQGNSFSDTSSIIRRPSCDTISTYLSHESMYHHRNSNRGSFYAGSLGSQELIDFCNDNDSVFTDDITYNDSVSACGSRAGPQTQLQVQQTPQMQPPPRNPHYRSTSLGGGSGTRHNRVLSYPSLLLPRPPTNNYLPQTQSQSYQQLRQPRQLSISRKDLIDGEDLISDEDQEDDEDEEEELYVNQRKIHRNRYEYVDNDEEVFVPAPQPRQRSTSTKLSLSQNSLAKSHNSLRDNYSFHFSDSSLLHSSPSKTIKKRPIPTPRTVLNASLIEEKKYNDVDKLILKHSQFVIDPNEPSEICTICQKRLDSVSHDGDPSVVCLTKCQHKCHIACLRQTLHSQTTFIRCPECHSISGEYFGNMPTTGTLSYRVIPKGLPGYEDYHTIQITYNFQNGIQGPTHPQPNKPFFAIGFPRTAFIPDTEKGRKVLKCLEAAFNRKLTFTITARAAGQPADVITWEITHKTEFGPGEGIQSYPDPNYLDNVLLELAQFGIE